MSTTSTFEDCVLSCQTCHDDCIGALTNQCMQMGGRHAEPGHVKLMLACAEICQAAANVMRIGSTLHIAVCKACAEVCEACARSCERLGDMQPCADSCFRCADNCWRMSRG